LTTLDFELSVSVPKIKGGNQPSIFPAAFTHAKDVQHFGCRLETNRWRMASVARKMGISRSCPKGTPVGMSSNLQDKVAVSPLIE
jgi:hypothetical protein